MTDNQAELLAHEIRSIAGGGSTPSGLEAVAMSLAGEGLGSSVAGAILELATAVNRLADAVWEKGR